uniref:Gustatory receptor n=1 Tax=Ditylenchus dipsaci TaxID=166011 RepID=A0A915CZ28_9BILA
MFGDLVSYYGIKSSYAHICCFPNYLLSIFVQDANRQAALGTIVTSFVSVALSLTEIFILASVTYFNEKRYNSRIFMKSGNSLSEAYQLSENIRTGKQLAPTFLCHFFNTLSLSVGSSLVYFKLVNIPSSQELLSLFFYFTLSFSNLCIQITVIRYHPILSKKAGLLYHDIKLYFCKCALWLTLIVSVSFMTGYDQIMQQDASQSLAIGALITYTGSVFLSFAEIFILSAMTVYNQQRYNRRIFIQKSHSLTESYQMSPNFKKNIN